MSEELEEKKTLEREQYSFSKLSTWWQCPYGFYLKYIEHQKGIGNAFSSYGSFVHELLEKYAKGDAEIWDLPSMYEWEFDVAVPEKFPWNKFVKLRDTYYQQGLDFLQTFEGYDNYKILGVEQEFTKEIDDWTLSGFIDLLFEDENGKLIIRDYKSKAGFKNAEELKKYARQLYLYSTYVKDTYGRFPDELQFLCFRKKQLIKLDFDENAFNEAIEWAKNTVSEIRNAFDYPPMNRPCDDFYADNLCNHRKTCIFRKKKKEE